MFRLTLFALVCLAVASTMVEAGTVRTAGGSTLFDNGYSNGSEVFDLGEVHEDVKVVW